MNSGKVKMFDHSKGFGFVKADNGQDIFFHISDIDEQNVEKLNIGADLYFETISSPKGLQAKNINFPKLDSSLSDESKQIALENIKGWKLEAKLDSSNRYFYYSKEVSEIMSGDKSFVIGRKGSGKTAISEYICSRENDNTYTQKLTFKNVPFNYLYSLDNQDYTLPNQYISIWKYLIYCSICKMMIKNEDVDVSIRKSLSKLFNIKPVKDRLEENIKKWTTRDFSLQVLGTGGKIGLQEKKEQHWLERLSILEDIVIDYADDSDYIVVFDELDEDYKDVVNKGQDQNYISLLTSLFKAVQDIKYIFQGTNKKIKPVIFLRDDIYDLIDDPDKNKWNDFRIDIDWNRDKIKKLLAFRISKCFSSELELNFGQAWNSIFSAQKIRVGSQQRKQIDSFDFITRSTHLRPRDYVHYLQELANEALENDDNIIHPQYIKKVDKAFSNYLKNELEDEIHGILPDIAEIFGIISEIRKQVFTIDEFKSIYMEYYRSGRVTRNDPDTVLRLLFHFSVIGNQPRPEVDFFRYKNKEARLNFRENIVVHRGLFKALQIL
ncbi:TPA: cold shock domain-containing protein [Vibrio harveyi]|nr:cold shock domain-containing protein [Vibrio harveyi]